MSTRPGNMSNRVSRLEALKPSRPAEMPFLWPMGQTLDDALEEAGLSLDQPVFAIRLLGPDGTCPVHDRDLHRLT